MQTDIGAEVPIPILPDTPEYILFPDIVQSLSVLPPPPETKVLTSFHVAFPLLSVLVSTKL